MEILFLFIAIYLLGRTRPTSEEDTSVSGKFGFKH